jgi:HEAT repeat protein
MTDSDQPPSPDRLTELLEDEAHEEAVACLDRLDAVDADGRKRALRATRALAEQRPRVFDGLTAPLTTFLTDDDRAVRLTTAKLFVTLARSEPTVVVPVVESLAARVADDAEFYYVRARCAEALGYVALDHPGEVSDPETLADFRVGLSFDEPEVKEKLAKALAYVALGDPGRLRHQASSLAEHLDDESTLVRYHLCTALVVVGCERPEKLSGSEGELRERLTDDSPYVQGRAAEALALLAQSRVTVDPIPDLDGIDVVDDDTPSFLTDRVRFARRVLEDGDQPVPDRLGTVDAVRAGMDDVVAEMKSHDGDDCPHCGLDLPPGGPPTCPRCGAPRRGI